MLRSSLFTGCLVLAALFFVLLFPDQTDSTSVLRRITNTSEEVLNLNPSLSGDGRFVAFESTADLAGSGEHGFHALRAELAADPVHFSEVGISRAVAPAISQDGSRIAFASTDNPLGSNSDGNSEIFLYNNSQLIQITNTTPDDNANRLGHGSFQPSISDDGRYIAFSSNRNLTGNNADGNFEIYIFNTIETTMTQLTNMSDVIGASNAKISGDGNSIAYVRDTASTSVGNRNLIVEGRLGGVPAKVIAENAPALTLAYGRTISDDGLRVVYSAETAEHSSQIFLWDGRNNITRQITQLDTLEEDVPLQATISGDGARVAFATRRNVIGGNTDNSVELYTFDIPSGQFDRVTNAPSSATAEVVSSLNDDGSLVAFSFPRVLSGSVVSSSLTNNSEIYVALTSARPSFGSLSTLNGASFGNEPSVIEAIAPASIAVARGNALAHSTQEAQRQADGSFPLAVAGTTVSVNGRNAQIFFVSPTQVNVFVPPATEVGEAEVIVTNPDGFRSRGTVSVLQTAPGVFTANGDGFGEGVILNADTLQRGPFDPTSGTLRLSMFATGVRNALQVSVSAYGHALAVESINVSPELPGMDEIHVLVPAAFSGAGTIDLVVRADGRESNTVQVTFTGASTSDLVINEVLADPPDGLAGDANRDGVRSSSEDEFLELVNHGSAANIAGWTVRTRSVGSTNETTRHTFAPGTLLLADEAMVVFGGGNFDPTNPAFGCARVVKATSGGLSLLNGGVTVVIRDAAANLVAEFSYGEPSGIEGDENQSLTRSPDIVGIFVLHSAASGANGRRYSAGLKTNGTPFINCVGHLTSITISPPSAALLIGETIQLTAQPLDTYGRPLIGPAVMFTSDNPSVVTVDAVSTDETTGVVTATVTGRSGGVAHITAQATEGATTIASNPATLTVLPPSTPTLLVITQVYGGGNNSGAPFQNDFVELFNRGTTAVDFGVTPYSVQYASAAGNFSNANKLNLNAGTIAPGQYFLIRLGGGTTNGAPLPTADAASAAINLSAADGKVALVTGTAVLGGNGCPFVSTVADFVGYGAANCAEGNPSGALNATRSARRISSCADTNSNSADFGIVTNPAPPRNSATALMPCP